MSELFIDNNEPKLLKDLKGMEKYVSQMDKWYKTLEKKFILAILGDNGCGKSLLARLFLEDKDYNLLYFDISSYKSKTHIYDKIKESFKSFDICSILLNKKKKLGYIIDNIDNSILSKNDILDLHSLFIKNDTIRPVIIIGKFNKNPNYPKKKIETMKIYPPTETTLVKIGKDMIKKCNFDICDINLRRIIAKCQLDIRKLLILLEYFNKNGEIDIKNIVTKDCDYNLFTDFGNLMSSYKKIELSEILGDQIILLNFTCHQNIYNYLITNCKKNTEHYLYDFNKRIYESIDYEYIMNKTQQWDFLNYLYYNGPKYISYTYDKIKKNKNVNIEIDYPKYCYISNQKNLYKKYIQIFRYYDFYDSITEDNFISFIEHLFKNKDKYEDIFNKLKKEDINNLTKVIT
tara:strand:+ start:1121 stop:2329 length:1209 start_codon:yes stop_codon:yes gene_type:complete